MISKKLTITVHDTDDDTPLTGEVEFTFLAADFGIGSYEYHGAKGFDSQPGVELDGWESETLADELIEKWLNAKASPTQTNEQRLCEDVFNELKEEQP
jgi:hypothetical protein